MSISIIQQKIPIIQDQMYDVHIRGFTMTSEIETFGDWLRRRRAELNISGAELERRSKVSRQYISNLERNLKSDTTGDLVQPSLEYVDKLARGLGVDIDEARLAAGYAPITREDIFEAEIDKDVHIQFQHIEKYTEQDLQEIIKDFIMVYKIAKQRLADRRKIYEQGGLDSPQS